MARAQLPPEIINLGDFPDSISILAYGDSGVGKTWLAATAPNALFLAPVREGGVRAAAIAQSTGKAWPIRRWSDIQKAKDWLEKHPDVFDWVIIDSLTHLQDVAMRSMLEIVTAANSKRDPDIPAMQDYLKVQELLKNLVTELNEQPFAKLYTAAAMRAEVTELEGESSHLVLPMIESREAKLSQRICGQMMVVGYYGIHHKTQKRRLLTQRWGPYFAKDRYHIFGQYVVEPNLADMGEKIKTKINAARREAA